MITPELLDYIKEELEKGDPPENITNTLMQKGWAQNDIAEGLNQLIPQGLTSSTQSFVTNSASQVVAKSKNIMGIMNNQNKKLKIAVAIVIILILFIGFLIPVLTVYANVKIPLMSDKFRRGIVVFTYHIPLLPKTSEQIILAAVDNNTKLTAYTPDFSLSANLLTADVAGISLDIKASGPVVIPSNNKISFDINFSAAANIVVANMQLSGKARKIGDDAYIKLDSLPTNILDFMGGTSASKTSPEIKKNLDDLLSHWIVINTTNTFQSEAKKNLDNNQQPIIAQVRNNVQDFLLRSNVMSEVKKMNNEKIDGVSSYHLRLIPSKTLIRSLIKEYTSHNKSPTGGVSSFDIENNFTDSVKNLQIDVWFGKNDAILRKTSAIAQFDLEGLSSMLGGGYGGGSSMFLPGITNFANTTLSVSTVLKISDIGKVASISRPSQTMTLEKFSTGLQDAFKTKAQREADSKKREFDSYFSSISNALSRYYVKNHQYPAALSELTGEYLSSSDRVIQNFGQVGFQTSSSRLDFIAYTTIPDGTEIYQYGITSARSYPHKFSKYDIDLIFNANSSSRSYPYR